MQGSAAESSFRYQAGREGIGYHYCPQSSWETIQREGLVPYPLARGATDGKDVFFKMLGGDVPGVYVWAQPHSGSVHTGNIVQRAIAHRTWRIVLIRVAFPLSDVIRLPSVVTHTGTFASVDPGAEPWAYHTKEPAILLSRAVPPERIALVAEYDLEALLAVPKEAGLTCDSRRDFDDRVAPALRSGRGC